MRLLLIALLATSCGRQEPRRLPESRAPGSPIVVAPAPVILAPAPVILAPALPPSPTALPSASAASTEAPAVAAADPRDATRKAAHDVLAEHCGQCHEGHRSTNAKALAVYDLDKPDWPARFDERRSPGALRRLAARSAAARDTFVAFLDAERAASSAKTN